MAVPWVPAPELYDLEALMKDEFFTDRADTASERENHYLADITGAKDRSYKPLVDKDEIRLLCLEPGDYGELRGELVHVHLDESPVYEALSYAWAPPYKTCKIKLPNGILHITNSLSIGLIHLRSRRERRLLWIDQLCINQDDNTEKIQQIRLMQRIYSSASQTLVWLGEDEGNGHIALNLLEKIGKADTSSLQSRRISAEWVRAKGLPDSGDIAWFALLKFWGRSWFRRTWVIQEFVLAKDALIICGDAEMNWKVFASAHEKMMQYGLMNWRTFNNLDSETEKEEAFSGSLGLRVMMEIKNASTLGPSIANIVRSFSERDETALEELLVGPWGKWPGIPELVMQLRKVPEVTGPVTRILGQLLETLCPKIPPIRLSLCHLLFAFGKSEATDPRDRLFALLGLASDGDDASLIPNYVESIGMVFLGYSNHFVRHGDGINLLYQAVGASKTDLSIPSCVPDWTQTLHVDKRPINQIAFANLLYKAAGDTSPQIRCSDDTREIVISGVAVDIVSKTASHNPENPFQSDAWLQDLQRFFKEADTFALDRESYVTGESLYEVQWRTLIANASADTLCTAPEEYGDEYRVCRQMMEDLEPEGPFPRLDDMNSYFRRLLPMMMMYKLCQTETGLIGLVPVDTIVGDLVYIFTKVAAHCRSSCDQMRMFEVNFKLLEDVIFMEL